MMISSKPRTAGKIWTSGHFEAYTLEHFEVAVNAAA
jgi:hypothetical protein